MIQGFIVKVNGCVLFPRSYFNILATTHLGRPLKLKKKLHYIKTGQKKIRKYCWGPKSSSKFSKYQYINFHFLHSFTQMKIGQCISQLIENEPSSIILWSRSGSRQITSIHFQAGIYMEMIKMKMVNVLWFWSR